MTTPSESLINLRNIAFTYSSKSSLAAPVFQGIDLDISKDDFLAIVGPNGAGKTTLVKIMLGLLMPSMGTCTRSLAPEEIGYIPQHFNIAKNFPGTVKEIFFIFNPPASQLSLPPEMDIELLLNQQFLDLSGGQQQRVLIALALYRNPKLLILDEPTAGIDITTRESFFKLLKTLNQNNIAIILITHEGFPPLVKRILYLNGDNHYIGKPEELEAIHHYH